MNNAAIGVFGRITDVPLADIQRVLDVNIVGYVNGARAALPRLRAQGAGVLANVASIVGEISQPYTAAYSISKAAVRALSVSIRSELQLDGIRKVKVCTVLPAAIDTPFFQHAANYTGRKVVAMPPVYTPERVAATIVALAAKPRREAVVGPAGRLMVLQHKITPAKVEAAMAVQVEKTHLSRKKPAADGAPQDGCCSGRGDCRRRALEPEALTRPSFRLGQRYFSAKLRSAARTKPAPSTPP